MAIFWFHILSHPFGWETSDFEVFLEYIKPSCGRACLINEHSLFSVNGQFSLVSFQAASMTASQDSKRGSVDVKVDIELEETAPVRDPLIEQYELIRDKSAEELSALNKSVVRKLDWKFLPMVCAMLMMK